MIITLEKMAAVCKQDDNSQRENSKLPSPPSKSKEHKSADDLNVERENELLENRYHNRSCSYNGSEGLDVSNWEVVPPRRLRSLTLPASGRQLYDESGKSKKTSKPEPHKYLYPPPIPIFPMEQSFPPVEFR